MSTEFGTRPLKITTVSPVMDRGHAGWRVIVTHDKEPIIKDFTPHDDETADSVKARAQSFRDAVVAVTGLSEADVEGIWQVSQHPAAQHHHVQADDGSNPS